jgi:hypothetical protein
MNHHALLATAVGVLVLGVSCPDVYGKGGKLDQAMARDIEALHQERKRELRMKERLEDPEDDEQRLCPEDKIQVEDCTSLPCKVECQ